MKRLIKLGIALLVRAGDVLAAQWAGVSGKSMAPKCVVLYYHAVSAAHRRQFARQMDELLRQSMPVRAEALGGLPPACGGCVLTFDDGFVSVLENALPELERRGIPATLFVPTGCLGQRPSWIQNQDAPSFRERVMAEHQLAALKDHALVTIGSHSVSHPRLPGLDDAKLAMELRQSKVELERILGREVSLFSFPHGAYDERGVAIARQAGYRRVFSIVPRCASVCGDEFVVGRVAVDPGESLLEFRLKLAGAYRWMSRRAGFRAQAWDRAANPLQEVLL